MPGYGPPRVPAHITAPLPPRTPEQDMGELLANYLAADWRPGAWNWGRVHCGTFVAGWVLRRTGRDALAGLEAADTLEAWQRATGGDMAALVSRQLGGVEPVPPGLARTGDVVLLPGNLAGGALGICSGRHAVVLRSDALATFAPMRMALHAWPLREVRP